MAGNSTERGRSVTSKIASVLTAFTGGPVFSLTELARLTCMPVSTTYRLVRDLVDSGAVERTEDGRYRIGVRLRELAGPPPLRAWTLHERARRMLEDVSAATGADRVRLGVLEGLAVAYLDKASPSRPVSPAFEPDPLPAHATALGKLLLAYEPPDVVARLVDRGLARYTTNTITDGDRLLRSLAIVRGGGYAVCRGEFEPDRTEVAVPVRGADGAVVAAVGLSPRVRQTVAEVRPTLDLAARRLSRDLLGYDQTRLVVSPKRHLDLTMDQADEPSVEPFAAALAR